MVAKVNSGKSMRGVLNYNENKVKAGVAHCLHENLFGQEVTKLSFSDKLNGFEKLIARNRRATTNAVHISLNFHPEDQLSSDKLIEIANTYMHQIGFGNQPYLVYQHTDAAHPHMHIITTNIQRSGKRIILYNIGRNQSEKARQQIEKEFKLIRASGRQHIKESRPLDPHQMKYGKVETKRTIANVVQYVTRTYRYTSVPELNAVLGQYHILADRGSEHSQMIKRNGLLYRMLDANGNKVGVPIKASALYSKPTMKYLEKQIQLNAALRTPHKERIKQCLDAALRNLAKSSPAPSGAGLGGEVAFTKFLHKENITVVFRKNDAGRLYGLTFVDNKTKVVFNGSDLGKAYTAGAIAPRLIPVTTTTANTTPASTAPEGLMPAPHGEQIISELMHAESFDYQSPEAALQLHKKRKRQKRKS